MAAAFVLAPRQDLGAAPELRDWLLARRGDAVLDASAVEVVTTPVLQVLLAGGDHLRQRGWRLRVDRPSPAFRGCLAELGTDVARLVDGRPRPEEA